MIKLSSYWKCQLIGWAVYQVAILLFAFAGRETIHAPAAAYIFSLFPSYLGSVFIAHGLYRLIKRMKILSKRLVGQLAYIVLLTFFFAAIKFSLWLVVLSLLTPKPRVNSNLPAFYFTMTFFIASSFLIWNLIFFGYHFVQNTIKKEREKLKQERQLWEMEARILRMQMNPYFISESTQFLHELVIQKAGKNAAQFLTTFSKLLRILLQNGDKPFISLYTEIETCRCYAELEKMRMNDRLTSQFAIADDIDQHYIKIPALSIQPFIEKAIYYRIRPGGEGTLSVSINQVGDDLACYINGRGIDRKAYLESDDAREEGKKEINLTQSKGITQTKWFKENVSVHIKDEIIEKGSFVDTTVQLTFKAYNDYLDGID